MIYADNAATTELDIDAFEEMRPFLRGNYGNASQPYSFGAIAKKAIKGAREKIAFCIGANSDEIFFTSCGTESDNWAIKNGAGDTGEIITSVIEHHAVLNSCIALERQGRRVIYAPVAKTGEVDQDYIAAHITARTKLISIIFANNEIGTIQPIGELVNLAHQNNCLFHTDAVQAVGHIEISVHDLDIDMLSASAHKFNGPKGIGFLYVRKGIKLSPYMDGGNQENGLRAGTEDVASIVAMATALEKNCKRIKDNEKYVSELEEILIERLNAANIDYIRNGYNRIPGNINLSFPNIEGELILHRMDLQGICISTGSACDNIKTQISHVIKAIGVPEEYAEGTIRISLGKNNTKEHVLAIADALIKIVN